MTFKGSPAIDYIFLGPLPLLNENGQSGQAPEAAAEAGLDSSSWVPLSLNKTMVPPDTFITFIYLSQSLTQSRLASNSYEANDPLLLILLPSARSDAATSTELIWSLWTWAWGTQCSPEKRSSNRVASALQLTYKILLSPCPLILLAD